MYSDSGLCQKLTDLHFTFFFVSLWGFLSRFQQSTWLFVLHRHWSRHVKPPLGDCAYAPSSRSLFSTRADVQRYSSVREREMRGPFLISFLFSSFLLRFSSSLRIFWKASAVWSTWSRRERRIQRGGVRDSVVLGIFALLKQRSVCVAVCVTGCTGVTQWQLGVGC